MHAMHAVWGSIALAFLYRLQNEQTAEILHIYYTYFVNMLQNIIPNTAVFGPTNFIGTIATTTARGWKRTISIRKF